MPPRKLSTPIEPAGSRAADVSRRPEYQRIYATVDSIPRGSVATYGQVASEAGLPRHARLVGRALSLLGPRSGLPWHRVVNARGEIATRGTGDGVRHQRRRLEAEGVQFGTAGRVSLERYRWQP